MTGRTYAVAYAPRRTSPHWTNGSVDWGDICEWVKHPEVSTTKETGNYILAELRRTTKVHAAGGALCTEVHRDNASVARRSALLVLDADTPEPDFEPRMERTLDGTRWAWHTTYSSTPEAPRYRLLVAVDRPMTGVEYCEAAEALAGRLGLENFDRGTFEAARYMFLPGHPPGAAYGYDIYDGAELSVDDLVDEYTLLAPPPMAEPARVQKKDPLVLPGTMGAFNRAYQGLNELVEAYELPYEACEAGRWRLTGASSEPGMGAIKGNPCLWYSNHAHDPAFQQTCSAFDLVRIHRFEQLDEAAKADTPVNRRPSHLAMLQLALNDPLVSAELLDETKAVFAHLDVPEPTAPSEPDPDLWEPDPDLWHRLRKDVRSGKVFNEVPNWDLIREHDPVFQRLRRNDMTSAIEFEPGGLPWRTVTEATSPVRKDDRTELREYLQRTYRFREVPGREDVNDRLNATARQRAYHPVLRYLAHLRWDGTPRLAECLPGVVPTAYTRWVARKCLVAAVARVFQPGVFWDHSLVLYGGEGVGKSKWVSTMARGYSATLPGRLDSVDTMRVLSQNWMVVSEEGHALKRADFEVLKEFITRAVDTYRLPYETDLVVVPRQCVIWSTTNDHTFLRNEVGNRRFLVVHAEHKFDFARLTPEYVDQVWAEAVDLYLSGDEDLWVNEEQAHQAATLRASFTEESPIPGYVLDYTARLVPKGWTAMDRHARLEWMRAATTYGERGTEPMNRVCSAEILEVVLGKQPGEASQALVTMVTNALKTLPGWTMDAVLPDSGGYGPQLMFLRNESLL